MISISNKSSTRRYGYRGRLILLCGYCERSGACKPSSHEIKAHEPFKVGTWASCRSKRGMMAVNLSVTGQGEIIIPAAMKCPYFRDEKGFKLRCEGAACTFLPQLRGRTCHTTLRSCNGVEPMQPGNNPEFVLRVDKRRR